MEDCLAEAATQLLGRTLMLKSQQRRVRGFIPDLIFSDPSGKSVIVEVQQFALDRHHLYKCLEYRDLLAIEEGAQPEVILVCESYPPRYEQIIATHGIELRILDREMLIEAAVSYCPNSLRSHLLRPARAPQTSVEAVETIPRRYQWSPYDSLADIYLFASSELARCGLWKKYRYDQRSRGIFMEAQQVLESENYLNAITDPARWNIDKLALKVDGFRWGLEGFVTRI